MSVDNIDKHLGEMEEFIKMSDNINLLLDNIRDIDKADTNDLYELIYNKRKIESWLSEDITNENIKDSLQKLLQAITLLLDSLSESQLQTIDNNKIKDIRKINKSKYGNKEEYKGLKDVKDIQEKREGIIQKYILKSVVKFATIGLVMLFIMNGSMIKLTNAITDMVYSMLETPSEATSTTIQETLNTTTAQASQEVLGEFPTVVSGFMQIIVTLMLTLVSMRVCLDLIYMMMPMFREIPYFKKLASEEALELVRLDNATLGVTYEPKVVDYTNRVETATALLHNLEDYIDKLNNATVSISDQNHTELFINNRDMLTAKLNEIKSRINTADILKKLEALADAEIMYRDINVA